MRNRINTLAPISAKIQETAEKKNSKSPNFSKRRITLSEAFSRIRHLKSSVDLQSRLQSSDTEQDGARLMKVTPSPEHDERDVSGPIYHELENPNDLLSDQALLERMRNRPLPEIPTGKQEGSVGDKEVVYDYATCDPTGDYDRPADLYQALNKSEYEKLIRHGKHGYDSGYEGDSEPQGVSSLKSNAIKKLKSRNVRNAKSGERFYRSSSSSSSRPDNNSLYSWHDYLKMEGNSNLDSDGYVKPQDGFTQLDETFISSSDDNVGVSNVRAKKDSALETDGYMEPKDAVAGSYSRSVR